MVDLFMYLLTELYIIYIFFLIIAGPPSECTNLAVVSAGEKEVVLSWSRPSITGRLDFYYEVNVSDPSRPGEFNSVNQKLVDTGATVTYIVRDLLPNQMYRFRVTAHNMVSDMDSVNDHLRRCEVSGKTIQGGKL